MLREEQSKSRRYREVLDQDEVWIFNVFDGLIVLNETNSDGQIIKSHQVPADDDPFLLNRLFQNEASLKRCRDLHSMSVARNPPLILASREEVVEHFKSVAEDNEWLDENDEPDFYRAMDEAMVRQERYGQVGNQLDDMTDADGNIVSLQQMEEQEEKEKKEARKKSALNRSKVSPNIIALIRKASEFTDVKDRLSTKSVQRKLGLMETQLNDQDWLFVYVHASDSTVRSLAKKHLVDKFDYDVKDLTKTLKEEKGYTVDIDV